MRNLWIIVWVQILSVVLFLLFSLYQKNFILPTNHIELDIMTKIGVFICVGCILTGNFIFKRKMQDKMARRSIKTLLVNYNTAIIMKYALLEFAALYTVIIFFIKNNFMDFILTLIMLAFMVFYMPTRKKIIQQLQLEGDYLKSFENPDEELYIIEEDSN